MKLYRYEKKGDLARETKAIEKFVSIFGGTYLKLGDRDIDFRVQDGSGNLIAYVEVKGRKRRMCDAYPLPVSARKAVKLCDKKLNPVIIWACEDGIIYGRMEELRSSCMWGGRVIRTHGWSDQELMLYFPEQEKLTHVAYDLPF